MNVHFLNKNRLITKAANLEVSQRRKQRLSKPLLKLYWYVVKKQYMLGVEPFFKRDFQKLAVIWMSDFDKLFCALL